MVSVNLDIKNPNTKNNLERMPPEQLIEDILVKEQTILSLVKEIKTAFSLPK